MLKKSLIILIALTLITAASAGNAYAFSIFGFGKPKPAPVKTKTVTKTQKPAPKKPTGKQSVLGAFKQAIFFTFAGGMVDCHMPDGKTIKASKKDCDSVTDFWNKHKPSNPGPSNNSGGGSSNNSNSGSNNNSNNNSGDNPTPTPTPTSIPTPTPTVAPVTVLTADFIPCTSTSCGAFRTLRVTGTNFTPDARVELTLPGETIGENSTYFNSPFDAQYVGGNGSTEIITDFYHLPACTVYGVQVVIGTHKYIPVWSFAIGC